MSLVTVYEPDTEQVRQELSQLDPREYFPIAHMSADRLNYSNYSTAEVILIYRMRYHYWRKLQGRLRWVYEQHHINAAQYFVKCKHWNWNFSDLWLQPFLNEYIPNVDLNLPPAIPVPDNILQNYLQAQQEPEQEPEQESEPEI